MNSVLNELTLYSDLSSDLPFELLYIDVVLSWLIAFLLSLAILLDLLRLLSLFVQLLHDVPVQFDLLHALCVNHIDWAAVLISSGSPSPHLLGPHQVPLLFLIVKVDFELFFADVAFNLR